MYYITRDSLQQGPYSLKKINELLADGQLVPADRAWWEACDGWQTVAQIPGVILPGSNPATSVGAGAAATPAVAATAGAATPYAPSKAMADLSNDTYSFDSVSASTVDLLRQTRPWVLLLSVTGMVMVGLGFLAFLVAAFALSSTSRGSEVSLPMIFPLLLVMAFYWYPLLKLFNYAKAIKRLTKSDAVRDLDDALREQKSFWKYIGIFTLVVLIIYGALFLFMGAAAVTGFFRR